MFSDSFTPYILTLVVQKLLHRILVILVVVFLFEVVDGFRYYLSSYCDLFLFHFSVNMAKSGVWEAM